MTRIYIGIAIAVAVVGAGFWLYFSGYDEGVSDTKAAADRAAVAHTKRENELIERLNTANAERAKEHAKRTQIIRQAQAPCLDQRMPDDVVRVLRGAGNR